MLRLRPHGRTILRTASSCCTRSRCCVCSFRLPSLRVGALRANRGRPRGACAPSAQQRQRARAAELQGGRRRRRRPSRMRLRRSALA